MADKTPLVLDGEFHAPLAAGDTLPGAAVRVSNEAGNAIGVGGDGGLLTWLGWAPVPHGIQTAQVVVHPPAGPIDSFLTEVMIPRAAGVSRPHLFVGGLHVQAEETVPEGWHRRISVTTSVSDALPFGEFPGRRGQQIAMMAAPASYPSRKVAGYVTVPIVVPLPEGAANVPVTVTLDYWSYNTIAADAAVYLSAFGAHVG